jgi:CRISPR system Cascade subunit CasA
MTVKMTTECFNLVEQPWLPVTLGDGFPNGEKRGPQPRVSLREAFEHGDKIVDLRCRPHERIALMRLLICIAQAALKGPKDEEEWKSRGACLGGEALHYLKQHESCFNLFGDGARFLQMHGKGQPREMNVFRLNLIDEAGTTLFDGHIQPGGRLSREELAVALVAYQSFAAMGKTGGSEPSPKGRLRKDGKIKMEPQGGQAALCRDGAALHAFMVQPNLRESILWNLATKRQLDGVGLVTWNEESKPVWEYRATRLDALPETKLKTDYLARLVPAARSVWLHENLQTAESANGVQYGVFAGSKDQKTKKEKPGTGIREPSASLQLDKAKKSTQSAYKLVSASAGDGVPKAVWRELHSITVLRHAGKAGGPLALEHLRSMQVRDARLWCGALVGDQAKVGDVVESSFVLPVSMLEDADAATHEDAKKCPGPNRTYRLGVGLANGFAGRLQFAVQDYFQCYDPRDPKKKRKDRADSMKKLRQQKANAAATRFWTALEQKAESVLLRDVAVSSGKYWSGDGNWLARSPWGKEVFRAAKDAYDFACPHETSRQLRAYAAGLRVLFREKSSAVEAAKDDTGDDDSDQI